MKTGELWTLTRKAKWGLWIALVHLYRSILASKPSKNVLFLIAEGYLSCGKLTLVLMEKGRQRAFSTLAISQLLKIIIMSK